MTREEIVNRNIELAEKRLLYVLEHPDTAPPNGAHVIELPYNDPALLEVNLALAVQLARKVAEGEETGPVMLLPEVDGHVAAENGRGVM